MLVSIMLLKAIKMAYWIVNIRHIIKNNRTLLMTMLLMFHMKAPVAICHVIHHSRRDMNINFFRMFKVIFNPLDIHNSNLRIFIFEK